MVRSAGTANVYESKVYPGPDRRVLGADSGVGYIALDFDAPLPGEAILLYAQRCCSVLSEYDAKTIDGG